MHWTCCYSKRHRKEQDGKLTSLNPAVDLATAGIHCTAQSIDTAHTSSLVTSALLLYVILQHTTTHQHRYPYTLIAVPYAYNIRTFDRYGISMYMHTQEVSIYVRNYQYLRYTLYTLCCIHRIIFCFTI